MKLILKLLIVLITFGINYGFAAIDMSVSPIKYDLVADTGSVIVKTATLHNRGNTDIDIVTGKSDFIASGTNGSPSFVRYSELVHTDQQLSNWISLNSNGFTIPANSKKEITFTINIPSNATPGGHYGAVFFKNNNSEQSSSSGNNVGINVDYGIIILLKVNGDIINNVVINNIDIRTSGSSNNHDTNNKNNISRISNSTITNSGNIINEKKFYNLEKNGPSNYLLIRDNCLIDFTNSNFDGKCFDNPDKIIDIALGNEDKKNNKKNEDEKFNVSFKIPADNKGNTHVKIKGEIKLFDEDGKKIKQIGKKIIVNDKGAIIGEQIVDYIPINDNKGNILPGTKRIFEPEWQGFPYKERDDEGNIVINYKNPGEYYSDESSKENIRLLPWERICYDKQTKKINAKFDISYLDNEGKEVSFPSAKDFSVTYTRKYIGYNYYLIFSILAILIFLIILLWIILGFKKKKCINKNCRKKIRKDIKKCPYCLEKQKKKKK